MLDWNFELYDVTWQDPHIDPRSIASCKLGFQRIQSEIFPQSAHIGSPGNRAGSSWASSISRMEYGLMMWISAVFVIGWIDVNVNMKLHIDLFFLSFSCYNRFIYTLWSWWTARRPRLFGSSWKSFESVTCTFPSFPPFRHTDRRCSFSLPSLSSVKKQGRSHTWGSM